MSEATFTKQQFKIQELKDKGFSKDQVMSVLSGLELAEPATARISSDLDTVFGETLDEPAKPTETLEAPEAAPLSAMSIDAPLFPTIEQENNTNLFDFKPAATTLPKNSPHANSLATASAVVLNKGKTQEAEVEADDIATQLETLGEDARLSQAKTELKAERDSELDNIVAEGLTDDALQNAQMLVAAQTVKEEPVSD